MDRLLCRLGHHDDLPECWHKTRLMLRCTRCLRVVDITPAEQRARFRW